jgi:hypothetical protein
MGIPPKRMVMSKLIRRYFKRKGGVSSQEASVLKNELINCWEQNGIDHPKCLHLVPKYDRGWAIDMISSEKYAAQVKQYPAHFQQLMTPQIDQMYMKGRDPQAHWMNNGPFKMPKY